MIVILRQVSILYLFLAIGWLFGKKDSRLASHAQILSFLMVNLFLPCKVVLNLSENFTRQDLKEQWIVLVFSLVLVVALHFLSKLIARFLGKEDYERTVYEYSLVISNSGYMGYALIESVFGGEVLSDMIIYCVPFSFYTYTVGFLKLSGSKIQIKKLLNPMTAALVIGVVLGVAGISLPDVLLSVMSTSSACSGPISMLLVGLVLSSFPLSEIFSQARDYALIAVRLVILPLAFFLLCKLPPLQGLFPSAVFVAAMPTGLNPIVFAKNAGKSPLIGARLGFLSHLFSIVTLPIWLSLAS